MSVDSESGRGRPRSRDLVGVRAHLPLAHSQAGALAPFLIVLAELQRSQAVKGGEGEGAAASQWVNESKVAESFHKLKGLTDRVLYRATRQSALHAGAIEYSCVGDVRSAGDVTEDGRTLMRLLPRAARMLRHEAGGGDV